MAVDRADRQLARVRRGKYRLLYEHLSGLRRRVWRTSFGEIEAVLGFEMPPSARLHRSWWGNQRRGHGHPQALAWSVAGWETVEVDMAAETLVFRRAHPAPAAPRMSLDQIWPVHPTVRWPEGLSLGREDLYGPDG